MESTRLEKRGIERTIRTKHESQHESINFHYNNNSLNAPIVANYFICVKRRGESSLYLYRKNSEIISESPVGP